MIHRTLGCLDPHTTVDFPSGRSVLLNELLAEGGFSYVYKCVDTSTNEVFAVKKLPFFSIEQERLVQNEIHVHKILEHPNLLPLLDFAQQEEHRAGHATYYYLLFPLHPRGSLRDYIDSHSPPSEKIILGLFKGVCAGLLEMHSRSDPLAHRDVKVTYLHFPRRQH
jgi:serine/threonine protein kinase